MPGRLSFRYGWSSTHVPHSEHAMPPMRTEAPPTIFVAGIDPAAHTGLVVLELPRNVAPGYERLKFARWAGSARLNPITRKKLTAAEETGLVFDRLVERLKRWGVREVAVENPKDGMAKWSGAGERRGTAFAIGRAFERCQLAAYVAGAQVHAYSVTEWMPKASTKGLKHTQKREQTLAQLDELSRELRVPSVASGSQVELFKRRAALPLLSEDERMALGVLCYHLARRVPHDVRDAAHAAPSAPAGIRR